MEQGFFFCTECERTYFLSNQNIARMGGFSCLYGERKYICLFYFGLVMFLVYIDYCVWSIEHYCMKTYVQLFSIKNQTWGPQEFPSLD